MANTGWQTKLVVVLIGFLVVGCVSASTRVRVQNNIITQTSKEMLNRAHSLRDYPGLRFPFADPYVIVKTRCFGLHPWSADGERHGGIDIIPRWESLGRDEMRRYRIVAPERGVIARIATGTTGAGAPSLTVALQYNKSWFGLLTFEPQSLDEKVFQAQAESIKVKAGMKVNKGDLIGELIVCNVMPGVPPHLHYGLLYLQPGYSLDYVQAHYLDIARSDGTNLLPMTDPAPSDSLRLIPTPPAMVFCAYEYSSPRARGCFDSYPKLSANGSYCAGVCAYNSVSGNCGDACPPSLSDRTSEP